MDIDADALVVGAGPAGSAAAILLARAHWRVILVEQHVFPRRKVCGECIAPGNLSLFDELGVGDTFRRIAGPDLQKLGWMSAAATITAASPACYEGPYHHGRVVGRDRLDGMLLERARALGVRILQPAKLIAIRGHPPRYECDIKSLAGAGGQTVRVPVVIDAHGSWESSEKWRPETDRESGFEVHRGSDLFAFKANFRGATLAAELLSVIALPGGYGGMVLGNDGRTTLAICVRRDVLAKCRDRSPGATAGSAVEGFVRRSCRGVRDALQGATLEGAWLSVGPLRPGIRLNGRHRGYRIGNAAGEAHPLIGEGISMALQSAVLLSERLTRYRAASIDPVVEALIQQQYASDWRRMFAPRLQLAAVYAHIAMRPSLAGSVRALLSMWPTLLTRAARWASKARSAVVPQSITAESL